MVRFKNRYLVFELYIKDVKVDDTLNEGALLQVLRDAYSTNFGDYGSGSTLTSMQVRYFNPITGVGVLRCATADLATVIANLATITDVKPKKVSIRVLSIAGTIKTCKEAATERNDAVLAVLQLTRQAVHSSGPVPTQTARVAAQANGGSFDSAAVGTANMSTRDCAAQPVASSSNSTASSIAGSSVAGSSRHPANSCTTAGPPTTAAVAAMAGARDDGTAAASAAGPWPPNFLKGVAISVWQASSLEQHSNWSRFASRRFYFGQGHYVEAYHKTCAFWGNYEEHIALTAALGATAFRFSFEWARFQPNGPGEPLLKETVSRYHAILDCMAAHGIEPVATLHHFTHPAWFDDMGAFEHADNIGHFLDYTRAVFAEFGPRIRLWGTFNEPASYAFLGYIAGFGPPGKVGRLRLVGRVVLNMLRAHCAAYRAIKGMPGGAAALVGFEHLHISFVPASKMPYVKWISWWLTHWLATSQIMELFRSGTFTWSAPLCGEVVREEVPDAPRCLDWWGLNYYARPCIDWKLFLSGSPGGSEPLSDLRFRLDPKGLGEAIREASTLRVPVIVTETGVADKADRLRGRVINEYCGEVLGALASGYDVRGIFWWTLADSLEWSQGFSAKFGLYGWNPKATPASCMEGDVQRSARQQQAQAIAEEGAAVGDGGNSASANQAAGAAAKRDGDSNGGGGACSGGWCLGGGGSLKAEGGVEAAKAERPLYLREGSKQLQRLYKAWPDELSALRAHAQKEQQQQQQEGPSAS